MSEMVENSVNNIAVRYIHNLLNGNVTFDPQNPQAFVDAVMNRVLVKSKKFPDRKTIKETLVGSILFIHQENLLNGKAPDFFDLIRPLEQDHKDKFKLFDRAYHLARHTYIEQFADSWDKEKRRIIRPPGKALVADIDNFLTYQVLESIRLTGTISDLQNKIDAGEGNKAETETKIRKVYRELDPLLRYLPPKILADDESVNKKVKKFIERKLVVEQRPLLFGAGDPKIQDLLKFLDPTLVIALIVKDCYIAEINFARDLGRRAGKTEEAIEKDICQAEEEFGKNLGLHLDELQVPHPDKERTRKVLAWLKHPALKASVQNIPSAKVRNASLADYLWEVGQKNKTARHWKKWLVEQADNSEIHIETVILEFLALQAMLQKNPATSHIALGFHVGPPKSHERLSEKLTTKTGLTVTDHCLRTTITADNMQDLIAARKVLDANEGFIPQSLEQKNREDPKEGGYGVQSLKVSVPTGEIGTTSRVFELKLSLKPIHEIQLYHGGDISYRVGRSMNALIEEMRTNLHGSAEEIKRQEDFLNRNQKYFSDAIDRVSRWSFDLGYFNAGEIDEVGKDNSFAAKVCNADGKYDYADPVYFIFVLANEVVKEINGEHPLFNGALVKKFTELCQEELKKISERTQKNAAQADVKKQKKSPALQTTTNGQQPLHELYKTILDHAARNPHFLKEETRTLLSSKYRMLYGDSAAQHHPGLT